MLARLNPALRYFTPARALTPHEALQLRVLVSGTLIGLVVAAASVAATILLSPTVSSAFIVAFGIGCVALLVAIRAGASMQSLRIAGLVLLGAFFSIQCLQTAELDWASLKWLTLLPILSCLLADAQGAREGAERPVHALWSGTAYAVLLSIFIVVANSRGWTAGVTGDDELVAGVALGRLIDFILFALSVAGLMSAHRVAQRRLEEELRLLRTMLSVCAWCRRVHDADAGWIPPDHYIVRHGDHTLSHGMCPDCERTMQSQLR